MWRWRTLLRLWRLLLYVLVLRWRSRLMRWGLRRSLLLRRRWLLQRWCLLRR